VPSQGEPGVETWAAKKPITGGGSTWATGSYDPSSDTLYWSVGNPFPMADDHDRPGDNLYTDSVLGSQPKDRCVEMVLPVHASRRGGSTDAAEPNVLVDTVYRGKPSKLLLHADRNGFFYVLDRTNGEVLLGQALPAPHRLGFEHRIRRPAGGERSAWLPQRCRQLGLHRFLPRNAPLLFPGAWNNASATVIVVTPMSRASGFLRAVDVDNRRHRLGSSPAGGCTRQDMERCSRDRRWAHLLWSSQRGFAAVDQRDGKTLWQFPTNVFYEGIADDLYDGSKAIPSPSRPAPIFSASAFDAGLV